MEVKVTGHSHNLRATLQYIYGNHNEAHQNNNGITKRNQFIVGLNGVPAGSDFNDVYDSMRHWNLKKPRNKVKSTQVILSFSHDELDFRKGSEDVSRALSIARNFSNRAFPNHAILLAAQNDNKNATSHVHIIVDEINQTNLKALTGSEYGIQRLRHYGKEALDDYNKDPAYQGEEIKGLSKLGQRKPTKFESILISRLQPVLSDTSITSQSKFRKACKAKNVRAKFIRHRHYITARGSDGKKHYVLNKNGKRKYMLTHGLVFKAIGKGASRGYIRSSDLARFDDRLAYNNLAQVFDYNKHPTKSNLSSSVENSISHPNSAKLSDSPTPLDEPHATFSTSYSSNDSSEEGSALSSSNNLYNHTVISNNNNSINNNYINDVFNQAEQSQKSLAKKKAKFKASVAFENSLNSRLASHKNSYASQWNANIREYKSNSASVISNYNHSMDSLKNITLPATIPSTITSYEKISKSNDRQAKDQEDLVNHTMPKFHNLDAQRYAYWGYNHVIPAKVVGYHGKIPVFAMNDDDQRLFNRMINPVVNGFRHMKRWALTKWRAGKRAIYWYCRDSGIPTLGARKGFKTVTNEDGKTVKVEQNEPLINDLAKRDGVFKTPKHLLLASRFSSDWRGIKHLFNRIIQPMITQSSADFDSYGKATNARTSVTQKRLDYANTAKLNYKSQSKAAEATLKRQQNNLKSDSSAWVSDINYSVNMLTPEGRARIRASEANTSPSTNDPSDIPPTTPGGGGPDIE